MANGAVAEQLGAAIQVGFAPQSILQLLPGGGDRAGQCWQQHSHQTRGQSGVLQLNSLHGSMILIVPGHPAAEAWRATP
jgi:hypothetical protein